MENNKNTTLVLDNELKGNMRRVVWEKWQKDKESITLSEITRKGIELYIKQFDKQHKKRAK